ncbi:MAG: exodeoxyribonuclease V subunit gamma [Crocinitomicaceae bacterium]|nr:exodeoxyribonuclease V subunit gamma [Crocinitomicaceae bacterium]
MERQSTICFLQPLRSIPHRYLPLLGLHKQFLPTQNQPDQ